MSCQIYNEQYLQFIVEDNICKELRFHDIENAVEIFNEFFCSKNFSTTR